MAEILKKTPKTEKQVNFEESEFWGTWGHLETRELGEFFKFGAKFKFCHCMLQCHLHKIWIIIYSDRTTETIHTHCDQAKLFKFLR